jgi:nucleotide-binding universal stress UspA family protein
MDNQTGRIVVGYDGSPGSCAALDWAAAHAQRRDQPLTVVHVLETVGQLQGTMPTVPRPDRVLAVTGHPAEQITTEGVERARRSAGSIDINAITHVSRVAYSLIENSRNATLLVVGTRGHGELGGALLGSVAFAVSGHAHCPVIVVRGDASHLPGPDRPVVVGVDTSAGSEAALRFAADTAAAAGAPLAVICAYQSLSCQVWFEPGPGNDVRSFEAAARKAAEQAAQIAVWAATKQQPGLDVQHRTVEAPTTIALSSAGNGAGLLVVGTRGSGGFAGLKLGSVSHGLIHSAPCPVAVVPAGAETAATTA